MKKAWKVCKIVLNVLLYVVLALVLFVLIVSIATKKGDDGAATIFGKQMRIVQSDSMAKCELTDVSAYEIKDLPVKTLLVIETVPKTQSDEWYRQLKEGDVLTFRYKYTEQVTITHRISKITEKETGGFVIELTGDNKSSEDNLSQTIDTSQIDSFNYVIGKVVWANYPLGWLIYALRSPVAVVCLIIIPCAIVIVLEIVRIVNVLNEGKRTKALEQAQKQEEEIERLKRKLAELEDKE
ncbi:MAG: hypothetical protein IJX96_03130 [Clostridia bacterium]|nr:hypothetical protein [Clostridia bacterium]